MSNAFPSPFAATDLANPSDADPGDDISAAAMLRLGQTLNYLHAEGNAGVVVSQTIEDSLCGWNTTTKQTDVMTWPVPVLSSAHDALTVEIRASASGNAATVDFNLGASTVSITVPVGVAAYHTHAGSLTSDGGTSDVITMDVTAGASGVVTIEHVRISIDPLSTPLDGGLVGDFEPFGETSLAADYCLPSHRGAQMIDALAELMTRPRSLMAWSGLDNVSNAHAEQLMGAHHHTTWAPAIIGAADAGVRYECHALLHSDPDDDTRFRLLTSADPIQAGENEVLVNDAAATAWKSVADDGESGDGAELAEGDGIPGLPGSPITVKPQGARGQSLETSSAGVASVAVWGP